MSATGDMFEQIENDLMRERKKLHAYQATINRIDDFFEYSNESKSDRKFIHEQLNKLTNSLIQIK